MPGRYFEPIQRGSCEMSNHIYYPGSRAYTWLYKIKISEPLSTPPHTWKYSGLVIQATDIGATGHLAHAQGLLFCAGRTSEFRRDVRLTASVPDIPFRVYIFDWHGIIISAQTVLRHPSSQTHIDGQGLISGWTMDTGSYLAPGNTLDFQTSQAQFDKL